MLLLAILELEDDCLEVGFSPFMRFGFDVELVLFLLGPGFGCGQLLGLGFATLFELQEPLVEVLERLILGGEEEGL